ncbi:MBL fold metallo-hydrolase [Clostridium sp. CS001]|uniref:ComEC/Rec2 family competence protein n=1 Tax=Clostridium sp. CS001 TaxID=2880648 RepID=UPI001CF2660A|nr:ComEC/Rec2 family competence protein [Clostridium sp. CS001]MCB2289482.1 MBL fold metallo-hydrolase [Clostridium sp. CS001]
MKNRNYLKYTLFYGLLLFVIITTGCSSTIKTNLNLENNIVTHFIDVGQGDCTLIQVNNKNLLIDSGTPDSKESVIRYLKNNNIKNLDYVIATHPHDDHIGGMDSIIKNFVVGEFYAPKVTASTESFESMIGSLKNKGLKIKVAKSNIKLDLGPDTSCIMLSPNKLSYKDTNNYSCVIKVSYKNSTYLFTGDMENLIEQELLNKGYDLKSDVLKVAHHGSNSSTSQQFLNKVSPQIAVISCGVANIYGHPTKETLDKLKKVNCTVYRTDLDKNIILISDGVAINRLITN